MPRLEYFLVANSLANDGGTNRLSVFDILDQIWPQKFPAILPNAALISQWNFGEEEKDLDFQFSVKVTPPKFPTHTVTHNVTAQKRKHRVITAISGVPLVEAGRIMFELFCNGQMAGTFETEVHENEAGRNRQPDLMLIYPEKAEMVGKGFIASL